MAAAGAEEQQVLAQRLKAAVHYTVGCLCQEVEEDKDVQFSKQTIAAISEITFRQCEIFAKDLEMFARHAKRTTVTTEDVKLLARRSNSLAKVRNSLSLPQGAESPNINTGITGSLYSLLC
ncbi:centromere protein S isoform X1 [Taeniopygia guttata]|uniref:centromere protein S isoform X1 n=1 Tax=Taeniopygia guttata TaxID=59729 RepID=UPI003BB93478